MSKHTPGPWKIITSWNDYMVEGPNGKEIIWQDGNYDTPTISLEDACLIAAAPDLLEVLKAFSDYVRDEQMATDGAVTYSTTTINHLAFLARAAIAKAKGEQ